jgi:IS5 family transposase
MAKQMGFAEAFVAAGFGRNARLEKITALIDWAPLERLMAPLHTAQTGRPPYPTLSLFKGLLLQQWYGLSDPGLEEALSDRASFRFFCGFNLSEAVPDETTFCRFRGALAQAVLAEALFAEINRQLEAKGFIVKRGTLLDATLVQAAVRPPRLEDGPQAPARDPDAAWTVRKNPKKTTYGYKAHVAADQGRPGRAGLIRQALMTPANIHDSTPADDLVQGDEAAVYGDRAYDKAERRQDLRRRGIKDRIMHRAPRGRPLDPHRRRRNRLIAKIRAAVEGIFGTLKRGYGYVRVRYRGLLRNHAHLQILCIAFNLRRAIAR